MQERISYAESCRVLQRHGLLDAGGLPPLPKRGPRHDDENISISFFRTRLADVTLDGLSLPRSFFGRSEIATVSFRGTDLSESTANWNDWLDVDFSFADLSRADLRESVFKRCCFQGAVLRGTDLRRTAFRKCSFADSDLTGAKLTRALSWHFSLSHAQRSVIDWTWSSGPVPEGG